jgi:hypothetical protein
MEVVLPAGMTVAESHDIALGLQHKIESLEEVERAFVHVDYLTRDGLEHKVERELVNASSTTATGGSSNSPRGGVGGLSSSDPDDIAVESTSFGLRSRSKLTIGLESLSNADNNTIDSML